MGSVFEPLSGAEGDVEEATEALADDNLEDDPAINSVERILRLIQLDVQPQEEDDRPVVERQKLKRIPKRVQQEKEPQFNDTYSEGRASCLSVTPTDSGISETDKRSPDGPQKAIAINPVESSLLSSHGFCNEPESTLFNCDSVAGNDCDMSENGNTICRGIYEDVSVCPNENRPQVPALASCELEPCHQSTHEFLTQSTSFETSNTFDGSTRIGNNAILRMMIQLFHNEAEEIYKVYLCYRGDVVGIVHRPPLIFFLLTTRSIYILKPVHESNMFTFEQKLDLSFIDHIIVDLNYQGFKIIPIKKSDAIEIHTASEDLTRNILSSLDLTIRRANLEPPNVFTESSMQVITIKKSLANFMNVNVNDIDISHFVLVYWHKLLLHEYMDPSEKSSSTVLTAPDKMGMLMYKIKGQTSSWNPGYFVLKNGNIYSFADFSKKSLTFFAQLYGNQCKGCQRVSSEVLSRPYVVELILVINNRLETLYLAASSEGEALEWMQVLLKSVINGPPESDGRFNVENTLEKFCYFVIANDCIYGLVKESHLFSVIGSLNVSEVSSLCLGNFVEPSGFCYLIIELEAMDAAVVEEAATEWILYFISSSERSKFVNELGANWEKLFQVSLPVQELDASGFSSDVSLMTETVKRLNEWHKNAAHIISE